MGLFYPARTVDHDLSEPVALNTLFVGIMEAWQICEVVDAVLNCLVIHRPCGKDISGHQSQHIPCYEVLCYAVAKSPHMARITASDPFSLFTPPGLEDGLIAKADIVAVASEDEPVPTLGWMFYDLVLALRTSAMKDGVKFDGLWLRSPLLSPNRLFLPRYGRRSRCPASPTF